MAIDIIGTFGGYYLQYDTDTSEYIVNPEGDSLVLVSLGFNNTRLTQSALSALHDGNSVFSGRSDFAGDVNKFPLVILDNTKALSNTMKEQLKRYVDRDPVLSYTGLTTIAETDLTEDPENPLQVYYDAPFTVDAGMVYEQLGLNYRWYFTKGEYGLIEKSISFTDQHTARTTILSNIEINFIEQNTAVKIYDFISDEFLFINDQTSVDEINNNPAGTLKLKHRTTPVYDTTSVDYYHTTEALKNFVVTPRSAPVVDVQVSPQMTIALDCTSNLSYRVNDTKSFKPEETWFQSKFFKGTGTFYIFGRCGTTVANGTYAYANNGNLDIRIGGTLRTTVVTYDTSKVNYIAWENRFNGTNWVDDLVFNETVVYSNRSTDRGTLVADVLATEGGIWDVDVNVDPDTDAQQGTGGLHSALRIGFTESTIALSAKALFYRNYKHFLTIMCGDSYVEGVPAALTKPHWKFGVAESDAKYYRTEYVNVGDAGTTFYNTLPITPDFGKDALPPWVVGSRPSPTSEQSCEYMLGFMPDDVTMSFNWNETAAQYNQKNIDGWNSYADELYWGMITVKDYMESRDIVFNAYGHVPTNTLTTKIDGKTHQQIHKEMADAFRDNLNEPWFTLMYDQLVDVDGLSLKSTYSAGDNIHVNDAGQLLYANALKTQRELYLVDRRDKSFPPVFMVNTPSINQTFSGTTIEAHYFHDGVFGYDSYQVTSETTSLTVGFTNTAGKSVSTEIPISYIEQLDSTLGLSLPLTDDYTDVSGRCRNIIKENGSPVITSGSLSLANSTVDALVIPNSLDLLKKDEEWSLLLECFLSGNGAMIGRYPTTAQDGVGFKNFITSGNLYPGNRWFNPTITGIPINTWFKLMLVHAPKVGGGFDYKTFYDGILKNTTAGDVGNENTTNMRIGASITTNIDNMFNNSYTNCSTMLIKNVLYYERALTLADFQDYEAGTPIAPPT